MLTLTLAEPHRPCFVLVCSLACVRSSGSPYKVRSFLLTYQLFVCFFHYLINSKLDTSCIMEYWSGCQTPLYASYTNGGFFRDITRDLHTCVCQEYKRGITLHITQVLDNQNVCNIASLSFFNPLLGRRKMRCYFLNLHQGGDISHINI